LVCSSRPRLANYQNVIISGKTCQIRRLIKEKKQVKQSIYLITPHFKGIQMLATLHRMVIDNYKLAYLPLKEIHDLAKNKKTMVIRELIETTMNRSY